MFKEIVKSLDVTICRMDEDKAVVGSCPGFIKVLNSVSQILKDHKLPAHGMRGSERKCVR